MLIGGILAAVAFFLPFNVPHPEKGMFGPGSSLLDGVMRALGFKNQSGNIDTFDIFGNTLFYEPIAALLLIASGLLTFTGRRAGYLWGLSAALLCLTFLLWFFSSVQALFVAFNTGVSVGDVARLFGVGYWLAGVGGLLGLVGALLGLRERPELPAQTEQQSVPGRADRVAALLILGGGVLVVAGFFINPFFTNMGSSLFYGVTLSLNALFILWLDLLAMVLLVAGGGVALTGRKAAFLLGLVGALVELYDIVLSFSARIPSIPVFSTFAERFTYLTGSQYIHDVFQAISGIGCWVTVAGCVLGIIGALLGFRKKATPPVLAEAVVSPMPS